MSCITEILKLKGDQKVLLPLDEKGKPWIAVEGGGNYKDYEYLIVLNRLGHRCGYVAIPPNHRFSNTSKKKFQFADKEREYYDYDSLDIECHGGLTFMKPDHGLKELLSVPCLDLWIGFDCGHCYDLADKEAYIEYFNDSENDYVNLSRENYAEFGAKTRSFEYVEDQCKSIINQLIEKEAA